MLRAEAIIFVNNIYLQQVIQSANAELQMPRAILTNVWHCVGWWSPSEPLLYSLHFGTHSDPNMPNSEVAKCS